MILILIAFKNLLKFLKNNVLIGIIIIISIMLSVSFSFFYKGLATNLLGKVRELVSGDYYITTPLGNDDPDIFSRDYNFFYVPENVKNILNSHPLIKSYSSRIDFYGQLTTKKKSFISHFHSFDPEKEKFFLNNFQIIGGKNLSNSYDKQELIVSEDISKDYEIKTGDAVRVLARTEKGLLREREFIVSGIFKSKFISMILDQYVYLRNKDADKLLQLDGKVSRLNIHLKNERSDFKDFIDFFQDKTTNLELCHWKKGAGIFMSINIIFVFTYFSFIIIAAILMMSSIGISIIMAISERMQEIGILSALGGIKRKILAIFLLEYVFLSLFCASIGFILAILFLFITSNTGVYIPDKNLAFMVGGKIFYPAWDNSVFLTGLLWPILITIVTAFISTLRGINTRSLNK